MDTNKETSDRTNTKSTGLYLPFFNGYWFKSHLARTAYTNTITIKTLDIRISHNQPVEIIKRELISLHLQHFDALNFQYVYGD